MKFIKISMMLVTLFSLTGCSLFVQQGVGTFKYKSNTPAKIENKIEINDNYSKVWDVLVKGLAQSFFVINNIDKESRIISISFSVNNPEKYIDCGRSYRTYTQGDISEEYNYDVAESSRYTMPTKSRPDLAHAYYYNVNRKTNLEGRLNIYVAPNKKNKYKTNIIVNTRYIYKIGVDMECWYTDIFKRCYFLNTSSIPDTIISFNTKEVVQKNLGKEVTCFSKGTIENKILDILRNEYKIKKYKKPNCDDAILRNNLYKSKRLY